MRALSLFLLLLTSLFSAQYEAKDYSHLMDIKGFNQEMMQTHLELYKGYVANTNELIQELEKAKGKNAALIRRRIGWEYDGMKLHELYFDQLGGDGFVNPKSRLYQAIQKQFGSFNQWKDEFTQVGLMRGIGWAILYFDEEKETFFNVWVQEHDHGHFVNARPIVILDLFEHAYLVQFQLNKTAYIHTFFDHLNWKEINERFDKIVGEDSLQKNSRDE